MKRYHIKYMLLAFSAAAFFAVLLYRAQSINEDVHNQYRGNIRQLEALHAVLNEDVLRARLGLLTYYDPLNETFNVINQVRTDLGHVPSFISAQGQHDINVSLEVYDKLLTQQKDLVEQFKTHNAVLINSLSYFTIVVSDVANGTVASEVDPSVKAELNNLLQAILLYDATTDTAMIARIDERINMLKQDQNKLNAASDKLYGGLDTLIDHANLVVEREPQIGAVIDEMLALSISQQISDLSNLYDANYEVARQSRNVYQIALYLFSLIAVGYISTSIIISLRRSSATISKAKEELQATYANLEKRSGQLQVANTELEKATQEAREASRLKDEFLTTMSHELRTPLNAIIGFQGLILMTKQLNERGTHMIERAQANAERLLGLINDILDISRIESGRLQLSPVQLPVARAVETWRSQMSVLAEQKGLNFSVNVDENVPPTVYIDEDAVTKIVVNLLGNAFKFTEKGGVELNLSRNNGNWIIKVADTGIGIPAHMQQIIFERFRQVDGSSKRKYGGSGLGLAIVSNLCHAMNGTITVHSNVDKGSTFTVTLPLETPPQPGGTNGTE